MKENLKKQRDRERETVVTNEDIELGEGGERTIK